MLLRAFPLSEKELSGLVIVKGGNRIIFFFEQEGGRGGCVVVDCILLHLSCTGDISCDIGRQLVH